PQPPPRSTLFPYTTLFRSLSFSATCHTVRPRSSALSSGHLRIAPPKSSSDMPKCFRYHAASAALSPVLLKKTPPTPVIFAIVPLLRSPILSSEWMLEEEAPHYS